MEEVINRLSGHRFYSQMDLCKGYWQLGLSKRSRPYTAFGTPKRLLQFKTMPFSLVNAGASFCRPTTSPILRLPVFNEEKPFILRSDASDIGIGAVLLQEFEGEGKSPIAYASKKLPAKVLNPRIMRWALKLQPYRFRIVAILGQDNVEADYLSR